MQPHRHTAGRLISESRCLMVLVVKLHGIVCEECDKLSLGLDKFRMG